VIEPTGLAACSVFVMCNGSGVNPDITAPEPATTTSNTAPPIFHFARDAWGRRMEFQTACVS
jgi:hypothetical protein